VRFVLELIPTPHGRVEGLLVREGSDKPERFSGWLDLLRLLESAAQLGEVPQRSLGQGAPRSQDVDAAGDEGPGFIELDESRGPPPPWFHRRG
jgi:hypothetical protein